MSWFAPKSKKRTSGGWLDFRKPLYEMKQNGELWESWIYEDTEIYLYDIDLSSDRCLPDSAIDFLQQSNYFYDFLNLA